MDKYRVFDSEPYKIRQMWELITQLISENTKLTNQINLINNSLDSLKSKRYQPDHTVDVTRVFIELDEDGTIKKDDNGVLKMAPLYIPKEDGTVDNALSSLVWDSDKKVWRLFCVYAPGEE